MNNITVFLAYIINSNSLFSFILKKFCFKEYWIFPLLFPLKTALNHVVRVFHFRGSNSWIIFEGQIRGSKLWVILMFHSRESNSWINLMGQNHRINTRVILSTRGPNSWVILVRHFGGLCLLVIWGSLELAWEVSKYVVISGPYFPVFRMNMDQKWLHIWTLFTQWGLPWEVSLCFMTLKEILRFPVKYSYEPMAKISVLWNRQHWILLKSNR